MTALRDLTGLVVIDEVQHRPNLFPVLRVLVDRDPLPCRFLVLGSTAPGSMHESSESLAGRLEVAAIGGFSLAEVGVAESQLLWLRGGLPPSYLGANETDSVAWRRAFVGTFLEWDLPMFGIGAAPPLLRRFWTMVAHYHGQVWNAAEPARSLGISQTTVRRYLDLLDGVFMVRQLQPWHAIVRKQQANVLPRQSARHEPSRIVRAPGAIVTPTGRVARPAGASPLVPKAATAAPGSVCGESANSPQWWRCRHLQGEWPCFTGLPPGIGCTFGLIQEPPRESRQWDTQRRR